MRFYKESERSYQGKMRREGIPQKHVKIVDYH